MDRFFVAIFAMILEILDSNFASLNPSEYAYTDSCKYSSLLVTCPVTSVKLQIANYFLLTANPINEISSTIIGLAVSKK